MPSRRSPPPHAAFTSSSRSRSTSPPRASTAVIAAADRHGVTRRRVLSGSAEAGRRPDQADARRGTARHAGAGLGPREVASAAEVLRANRRWRGTLRARRRRRADEPGRSTRSICCSGSSARCRACPAMVATRVHAIEVEDTAAAVLEFANGAIGVIEAATSAYPGYSRRRGADRQRGDADPRSGRARRGGSEIGRRNEPDRDRGELAERHDRRGRGRGAASPAVRGLHPRDQTGATPACDGREGAQERGMVEAIYTVRAGGAMRSCCDVEASSSGAREEEFDGGRSPADLRRARESSKTANASGAR